MTDTTFDTTRTDDERTLADLQRELRDILATLHPTEQVDALTRLQELGREVLDFAPDLLPEILASFLSVFRS